MGNSGIKQNSLGSGSLSGVDMGDNPDISIFFNWIIPWHNFIYYILKNLLTFKNPIACKNYIQTTIVFIQKIIWAAKPKLTFSQKI
jgi:hypothetical protein